MVLSDQKSILLKNGHVIDPATGLDSVTDILVKEGRISLIAPGITPEEGEEVIDVGGKYVVPGLVDCHVHLRDFEERQRETIYSGTRAAVMGGFTTVICEPNTRPPLDSCERLETLRGKVEREALCRVFAKAAMTKNRQGEVLTDFKALKGHPLVVSLSEDGNPIVDEGLMGEICRQAASHQLPLSLHCEDSAFSLSKGAVKLGFSPRAPFHNEPGFIARDLRLAREAGASVHVSHVSLEESVQIIGEAKRTGTAKITCEVAPHHLFLDEGQKGPDGLPITVNPPLRGKRDCISLQKAVKDGIIDVIASDHAPHGEADKKAGAPGLIGLETTLGVALTRLVSPGIISLKEAVRLMSTNPARIFGLEGGSLAVGSPADITVIDTEREWTVDSQRFQSLSRNCPFEGWRLRGQAVLTMVGGRVVMREGIISDSSGSVKE
ncbi:MAG: dihydroorotase [Candidatus Brocadiales bacterium]